MPKTPESKPEPKTTNVPKPPAPKPADATKGSKINPKRPAIKKSQNQ